MDVKSKVTEILKFPLAERQRLAEAFLLENEEDILNRPVSEVRSGDYVALISLYQDLAQTCVSIMDFHGAIYWLEKCVLIMNRDRGYRVRFALIYWKLSQYHCKILNHHKAAQYLHRFQAHADNKRYGAYTKKVKHFDFPFKKMCEEILGMPL
jgi:hypothetical protein